MNKAKCSEEDYINFIVATQGSYSCLEAGRVQSEKAKAVAHDAFTRLLQRLEPEASALWCESEPQVNKAKGVLVLDDTTLHKPYAQKMALVSRHWSGKHQVSHHGPAGAAEVLFRYDWQGRRANHQAFIKHNLSGYDQAFNNPNLSKLSAVATTASSQLRGFHPSTRCALALVALRVMPSNGTRSRISR